ncbi:TRAP transporter small permease subunit [Moorella sulfitireducens]|uniref:TRAP transporter small permease subunit n=1 Tax=Neomoorella sulfitireducens TaxID=2972948 RepID=UPI0021ACF732|nr:TRAP transporter small permease [Moorella sulfitireducens]
MDARDSFGFRIAAAINGLARVTNNIGIIFLMVMMMVTVVDVTCRYFGKGVLGAYEIVEYTMVLTVFLCIGHAQAEKKNVSVEILYNKLGNRAQVVQELVNAVVAFFLMCIFVYAGILQTKTMYISKSTSGVLFIPNYPFVAVEVIGYVVLCLVLLGDFLVAVSRLLYRNY